jgi:hypothetical protein
VVVVASVVQPEKTRPPAAKRQRTKYRVFINLNTRSAADLVAISGGFGGGWARSKDKVNGSRKAAAFADRLNLADYVIYMKINLITLSLLALAAVFLAGCAASTTETTTTRTQGVQYGR